MKKMIIVSSSTQSIVNFRLDMLLEFQNSGYNIIAVGNEEKEKWQNEFNKYHIQYECININRTSKNPFGDLKYKRKLISFFEKTKPDLIFLNFAKPVIYGLLACHKCGIENVYAMICGLGSVIRGSGFKISIIRKIMLIKYKKSLKYAKGILFQNDDDKNELVKMKVIENIYNIKVVNGSGVNLERFAKQEIPDKPIFLFVGRLIKDKGIIEYLEACEKIKEKYEDSRFMLVGPFDSNPTAIKQKDLDHYIDNNIIEYYGEQKDVQKYLKECSVFVLPSYFEGTPRSVLEAMAVGRIIITSDAPGCRNTVEDDRNGFLIPIKNTQALIDKMEYIINNFEDIKKAGDESHKIALEKFDVKKVNKEILDFMLKRR